MYYTYVLQSRRDGKLYIGSSDNLARRLEEHRAGKVPATRSRRPLVLVYYEVCLDQYDAIAREKALKTGFGRAYLKRRLRYS